MNKVCLTGRVTAKPTLRYTETNVAYARFNLAVNRNFTNEQGEREADFIGCVAWKKTAEMVANHLDKGSQIGVEGRIQTGSYDDADGNKRYTTDIIVENITFLDKKQDSRPAPEYAEPQKEETNEDPFAEFNNSVRVDQVSIDDNFLD